MSTTRSKPRQLTALLHESGADVLRFLQRRVGPDDAPDLFGETMLTVWRRIEDLPVETDEARMWLFGVARGTLLNHARGERRRLALVDRIRAHMPRTPADRPADEGTEVRDAISRLTPEYAEIIRLVHWDGFTLVDAARVIGIPAATARARYSRAKKRLRLALEPIEAALEG